MAAAAARRRGARPCGAAPRRALREPSLVAVGAPLPFPEARPYKPSKRYRVVQLLGSLAQKRKDRQERKAAAAQAA